MEHVRGCNFFGVMLLQGICWFTLFGYSSRLFAWICGPVSGRFVFERRDGLGVFCHGELASEGPKLSRHVSRTHGEQKVAYEQEGRLFKVGFEQPNPNLAPYFKG